MKKLIILLTALTGVFICQIGDNRNMVEVPQYVFFLFTGGLLLSMTLKNKWLTAISMLIFSSAFMTLISKPQQTVEFIKGLMLIFSALAVYKYFLEKKTDILKYLTIPVGINAVVMVMQALCPDYIPLRGSCTEVTGLLGNTGFTGCFIGITAPVFLRYFPFGWPVCAVALFVGHSTVGMIAFIVSSLVWLYFNNKKMFIVLAVLTALSLPFIGYVGTMNEVNARISGWLGTLDGIRYHWFKGWGLGSFQNIMSQNNDIYYGMALNSPGHILNHPANELLFGWWNFGILFPVLSLGYIASLFRQFTKEKLTVFCVLIGCLCVGLGFMFRPPSLFIAMAALGLYEGGKNVKESY